MLLEVDNKYGQSSVGTTSGNGNKVHKLVRADDKISIHEVADTCVGVLPDSLLLTLDQKDLYNTICEWYFHKQEIQVRSETKCVLIFFNISCVP